MNPDVADLVAEARRNHAAFGMPALPPGSTDLMYLVLRSDAGEVALALQDPSIRQSINTQNADGMTALMYAAKEGKGDVLEELKRAGAKTDVKTPAGKTARDLVPKGLPADEEEYLQNMLGGRRKRRASRASRKSRTSRKGSRKTRKH